MIDRRKLLKYFATMPHLVACSIFLIVSIIAYMIAQPLSEEFVVKPSSRDKYHIITEEVSAGAAIIYDTEQGKIIAGKNATVPKSIASITKLTAALLAFPRLDDTDITIIDSDDFRLTPNTSIRLGDQWRSLDLLEYSLITSSNRGMNAIGRTIEEKTGVSLVDLMNEFAQENGLVQTHFVNPTGLDAHNTLAGSESSALDLARIATIIIHMQNTLATLTTKKGDTFYSLDNVEYPAENTNKLIGEVSGTLLLSKTGYTDIAGGALVMVIEWGGRAIAFVVLESTRAGRFEDMRSLIDLYGEMERGSGTG